MEEQDTNAELEEAKEKLEALEKQIEGLQSGLGSALVQISQKAEGEVHFGGDVSNIVHWLDGNDISLGCEFITDTIDARIAFAGAANNRANTDAPIMHGDFLVLRCNSDTVDPNDPNPDPRSDCYYIGLCVEDCMLDQATPVDSNFSDTAAAAGDFDARHFVAWKTCGGGDTEGLTEDIDVVTNLSVTQTSPSADGCFDVTISYETKTLSFTDGLLKTVSSPTASSETFKAGCGDVQLCVDPWPSTITATVSGQPSGAHIPDGVYTLNLIQGSSRLNDPVGTTYADYGLNSVATTNAGGGNTVNNIEVRLDGSTSGTNAYIDLNRTSTNMTPNLTQAITAFSCELPITFTPSNLQGSTVVVSL